MLLDFERTGRSDGRFGTRNSRHTMQLEMIDASLEELGKTKEKNVYKVVGTFCSLRRKRNGKRA